MYIGTDIAKGLPDAHRYALFGYATFDSQSRSVDPYWKKLKMPETTRVEDLPFLDWSDPTRYIQSFGSTSGHGSTSKKRVETYFNI